MNITLKNWIGIIMIMNDVLLLNTNKHNKHQQLAFYKLLLHKLKYYEAGYNVELITTKSDKNGRKEMFYLTTHSTHFIYRYMVHSDREKGNPLPPHGLLFPISRKGSFICTIPQTG